MQFDPHDDFVQPGWRKNELPKTKNDELLEPYKFNNPEDVSLFDNFEGLNKQLKFHPLEHRTLEHHASTKEMCCQSEKCGLCDKQSTEKVETSYFAGDGITHGLSMYLCTDCYEGVMMPYKNDKFKKENLDNA